MILIVFGVLLAAIFYGYSRPYKTAWFVVFFVPLLGMGLLAGPSKSTTAEICKLRLVLCSECRTKLKGKIHKADYYLLHPCYKELSEIRYTKILDKEELDEFEDKP